VEKLRDDLTHMVAHDMRTPLAGLILNLEVLEAKYAATFQPRHQDRLSQAVRQASSVVSMIDAMLDVSRLEADSLPLQLEPHDLGQVAEEALAGTASLVPDWARVELERPERPVTVRCDAGVLSRVITNLVANALKYTQAGAIRVRVGEGGSLQVIDSGPGVPEAHRQRIFEKFGRVGPEGARIGHSTGLGLTFCKLAIEAHGGEIGVDSVVGQGSTFWIKLPA
jgi:signal transduction histidine kinase